MAAALRGKCIVQLSPFSKSGVALDSSYGLHCLPMILTTTSLTPTRFDVILFNFGLHDINYIDEYPEVSMPSKSIIEQISKCAINFFFLGGGGGRVDGGGYG